MGTFSIWHWLVVLAVIIFSIGLPILAILNENTDQRLGRLHFLGWLVIPTAINVVASMIARGTQAELLITAATGIIWLAIIYPLFQRYVRRARDAGMGKGIAYWSIVPLVNIVTTFILLFKGPHAAVQPATEPAGG